MPTQASRHSLNSTRRNDIITHNKFAKSTSALIAAFLLAAIFAACGSSESDEAIPYARVDSTSRIFEISDFENAGFKVVKKYDIEGLTGATAAMHGFHKNVGADPLSCELRFYNSNDEAVKLGQSLAVKVTGGGRPTRTAYGNRVLEKNCGASNPMI